MVYVDAGRVQISREHKTDIALHAVPFQKRTRNLKVDHSYQNQNDILDGAPSGFQANHHDATKPSLIETLSPESYQYLSLRICDRLSLAEHSPCATVFFP